MRLWSFLHDRQVELSSRSESRQDGDALRAVLAEHNAVSPDNEACAGCGTTAVLANGYPVPRTLTTDACPTLQALAWRWHRHPGWRREWSLPLEPGTATWPPSENCYCGGPDEALYAHRRGTRRHCRPSRAEQRWAARAGAR